MRVNVRKTDDAKTDDVVIVDLSGRMVAGVGDELLREVVNELLGESWKKILLNLSEVGYVDSSGVGELLASYRTARNLGASIKCTRMAQRAQRVLSLSQILPLLEVYETEEEAIAAFAAQEAPATEPAS